ncbi:MAG: polyprenyl synthetase family protein [Cellulosilyticaceae bacterium]
MNNKLQVYREIIEQKLVSSMPKAEGPFSTLIDAMSYSLQAGGKRIRPTLMQLAFEAVGGQGDISAYLCAIEMIHTYSLIHDDLPAMDNDDLRRGKPTNHVVFGEATAILAGDGLLNYAFECMLQDAIEADDMARVRAAHVLGEASGWSGMIGGQVLDMASEGQTIELETLDCIHLHKTGALLSAATKMGAILGHGSPTEISALYAYGAYLGKVFQIIDDVLDQVGETEALGKPTHSDIKNDKRTYTSFYTVDECYEIAKDLTEKAIRCLERVEGDTTLLKEIATNLIYRKH